MSEPAAPCAQDRSGSPWPTPGCRELPAAGPKATLQWQQEVKFAAFERKYG